MEKKKLKIFGISIYKILAYFIIYSIIGLILETLFAFIMYGKIESRQGVLFLPMIPIYGIGAVLLVVGLQKFNKNWITTFLGGILIGSIVEYFISLFGEIFLNVRWWDYSNNFLNINGRICLLYSIYWGIISIYLMKSLNPLIDKIINWISLKINIKVLKISTIIGIIIIFLDTVISAIAIDIFLSRTIVENNLLAKDKIKYEQMYKDYYENDNKNKFIEHFCNEKLIIKTYPNLRLTLEDNTTVYVQDYYKNIQPYYYKFK